MHVAGELLGNASVEAGDRRFLWLLDRALARVPKDVLPMRTVERVRLASRGSMPGLVGLTRWADVGEGVGRGRQTLTFYTSLLDELSDDASIGVIAHELAHAWLNEHLYPESSNEREKSADELARRWGFAKELDALEAETEPA